MPRPLELPPGGLGAFFDKLSTLREGRRGRVRITFWGDSHVAGEMLPGHLRRRLQETFGDAGPGFVLLGQPWPSYKHLSVKQGASDAWRSERIWSRYSRRRRRPRDDLFGAAGISVHARARAHSWVTTRDPQERFATADLYYLRQPRGGTLKLLADGRQVKLLLTVASLKEPAYARVVLPSGTRRLDLLTGRTGEVRLYGVDLTSGRPGVILDSMGINGAQASTALKWNERLTAHHLRQLAPDLMLVAYGSNELNAKHLTRAGFAVTFDRLLRRLQRAAPGAACLVVSPSDKGSYERGQGWQLPARLDWVIAEQRRLARQRGCAFWDQRAAMGGPRSIFDWVGADPQLAQPDHRHLTAVGYRLMADALHQALHGAWQQHHASRQARRTQPAP